MIRWSNVVYAERNYYKDFSDTLCSIKSILEQNNKILVEKNVLSEKKYDVCNEIVDKQIKVIDDCGNINSDLKNKNKKLKMIVYISGGVNIVLSLILLL